MRQYELNMRLSTLPQNSHLLFTARCAKAFLGKIGTRYPRWRHIDNHSLPRQADFDGYCLYHRHKVWYIKHEAQQCCFVGTQAWLGLICALRTQCEASVMLAAHPCSFRQNPTHSGTPTARFAMHSCCTRVVICMP